MIEIERVKRTKNGVVLEVTVVINNYWELKFIWRDGKPFEVERGIPESRIYDRSKLWIPKQLYNKMIRQLYAIFRKGEKKTKEVI